jgi:hypothetical protein
VLARTEHPRSPFSMGLQETLQKASELAFLCDTFVWLIGAFNPILKFVALVRQQMRDFKGKVCATTGRHRWRVVDRLSDFEFVHNAPQFL